MFRRVAVVVDVSCLRHGIFDISALALVVSMDEEAQTQAHLVLFAIWKNKRRMVIAVGRR